MLSVLDNAYLKKAQQNPSFNPIHQKILLLLLCEKKYYEKGELLCCANYSLKTLEKALNELSQTKLVQVDGWLVRITDHMIVFGETNEKNAISIKAKAFQTHK